MPIRRDLLKGMASVTLAGLPFTRLTAGERPADPAGPLPLHALPGKKPLIRRSFRPPNLETPLEYFNELYTPNDAFFVRYHLAAIAQPDPRAWRLRIGGDASGSPRELTLAELQSDFEQVEVSAVNQCSGNRRGLFEPRTPGVQWGYGAMGNARWRGVRLRDLLDRVGVRKGALEVVCNGADTGVLPGTPDFMKSIPVDKARDGHTLVAVAMNGEPLPHWHGAPARLVVPGWTATYWVKHLTTIDVVTQPFDGYWMKTAYRVPSEAFPAAARFASQHTAVNTPVTSVVVNSLITNVTAGQRFSAGADIKVAGIAWDAGSGIRTVEVSVDGGQQWHAAVLGEDAGGYSWRQWHHVFRPARPGSHRLMARATSRAGETQRTTLVANPGGYHHNLIQALDIEVG